MTDLKHTFFGDKAKMIADALGYDEPNIRVNDDSIYDTNTKVIFTVRSVEGRTVVDMEMSL